MNTLTIPGRGIEKEVPACFEEMTPAQVQHIFRLYASRPAQAADEFTARATLFLLGIRPSLRTLVRSHLAALYPVSRHGFEMQHIGANLVWLQQQLFSFLLREEQGELTLNYRSVIQHLPQLRIGCERLYGPADLLSDITFAEFRAAAEELGEYFETHDEHTLSRAIACLWRPQRRGYRRLSRREDFDGRRQQPYNPALTEGIARKIDRAAPWQRLLALLWLCNCMHHIQREDIRINSRTVNFTPLFAGGKKGNRGRDIGWTGVLYSLSKTGVFGEAEKVDGTALFDVLLMIYNEHLNEKKK